MHLLVGELVRTEGAAARVVNRVADKENLAHMPGVTLNLSHLTDGSTASPEIVHFLSLNLWRRNRLL